MIAQLGGFLGHKGDGEPSVTTTWPGLKTVHVSAKTLRSMRQIAQIADVYNEVVQGTFS